MNRDSDSKWLMRSTIERKWQHSEWQPTHLDIILVIRYLTTRMDKQIYEPPFYK